MNNNRGLKRVAFVFSYLVVVFMSFSFLVMAENGRTFTPEELAKYNGQNGVPAYVAVNGVVYDLTKVPEWANGRHFCSGAIAGKDITFLWNLAPRSHKNPAFLKRFIVVGKMVVTKTGPAVVPSPLASKGLTFIKPVVWGLIIAVVVSIIWLVLGFRKKKI
jgi:predicted heme/steroid binding protein